MTVAQLAAAQHAAGRPLRFDEYLAIVAQWLRSFGVAEDAIRDARQESLVWALERGSRSGRVAFQFAADYSGRGASVPA